MLISRFHSSQPLTSTGCDPGGHCHCWLPPPPGQGARTRDGRTEPIPASGLRPETAGESTRVSRGVQRRSSFNPSYPGDCLRSGPKEMRTRGSSMFGAVIRNDAPVAGKGRTACRAWCACRLPPGGLGFCVGSRRLAHRVHRNGPTADGTRRQAAALEIQVVIGMCVVLSIGSRVSG